MLGWPLFFTCVTLSGIAHWRIKNFLLATLLSVVASTLIKPVIHALKIGYLDGWWIIAMITIGIECLIISVGVGVAIRLYRKYGNK